MTDMVNNPPHYKQGDIECIDAIRAALTAEEFRGYCKGNALKYIWRELHKGGDESLAKAAWYLDKTKPAIDTGSELTGIIAKHGLGHEAVSEAVSKVNDGKWIEWNGGENPAGNKHVKVQYINGSMIMALASQLAWHHTRESDDIIAYRILEE